MSVNIVSVNIVGKSVPIACYFNGKSPIYVKNTFFLCRLSYCGCVIKLIIELQLLALGTSNQGTCTFDNYKR